jgi:hypothetical protein
MLEEWKEVQEYRSAGHRGTIKGLYKVTLSGKKQAQHAREETT